MTLRLRRFQGKWIAEDKEAGYYREMDDCDAYTLAGDFMDAEHIRLRVAAGESEHPPLINLDDKRRHSRSRG